MKLSFSIFFTVFASIYFLSGQDNSRTGAQFMMDGIIQHRKAKEACEIQDFISAHKWYDEALSTFINAKKAFEKDKAGKEKAKEQIELIRKEKEACRPVNKNSNTLEIGARSLNISDLVFQKSTGTGGIVGHIANLSVSNFSDKEMVLCFSNNSACPDNAVHVGMIYIANEKYQDYVIFGPLDFVIPAHSTFIIPVTGVCVQPDKDPVPEAVLFSKPETWILESDPQMQFSLKGVRTQNSESGLYIANAKEVWPQIPFSNAAPIIVESGKNEYLSSALIFDAIQKIDSTIQELDQIGTLQKSLFERNSLSTSTLIKLYSTWYYVGVLTGNPYTYEDFEKGIMVQVESGIPVDKETKMSISGETQKFWEQVVMTIQASGVLRDKT
ncbi:MAG: hypothetical protein IPI60_05170 [Saprospiraceae bacterium]|nr:hypothetical protein [Saprospiraceae bacterium]